MFSRNRFRWSFATLQYFFLGALVFFSNQSALLAQYKGEEKEEPKGYVAVYIIIIACVGVALLTICRASTRSTDFRKMD